MRNQFIRFGMSDQAQAEAIRRWMKDVLAANPGLSGAEWARRAGVAATTVNKALKPDYPFVTSTRSLAKLAAAANVAQPTIDQPLSSPVQLNPRYLPVRYRAQAGYWAEVEDLSTSYDYSHPVTPDPRYAAFPQWLEEVTGDSANQKLPDGSFAHVVDAVEMGYTPTPGDWVIAERTRAGGRERERSVKQVEMPRPGVVELWPRSFNPRWNEPLRLMAGAEGDDTVEVRIVGKVIGVYQPM